MGAGLPRRLGWELYDIDADPAELHDLAVERPALAAEWAEWAARCGVLPVSV